MFNQEVKDAFIEQFSESEPVRKRCLLVFNKIGITEEALGKDMSLFTNDEMSEALAEKASLRRSTLYQTTRIINEYLKWMRGRGERVVCDCVSELDDNVVQNYRNKMVFGIENLLELFDLIFGNFCEDGVYIIYRCYLWLAFIGVNIDEVNDIRTRDVDLDYMRVIVNGREYPLYKESIEDFRKAKTLKEFRMMNTMFPDKEIMMQREDGDRLLRKLKKSGMGKNNENRGLGSTLTRYTKAAIDSGKTKVKLSYSNVKLSGLFYRMYLREEMGFPVDFKIIAEMDIANEDIHGERRVKKKARIVRDYKNDYAIWKKAYELYKKDSHR